MTIAQLPTLFIGHGSPMNTVTDNPYRSWWQALGARFDGGAQGFAKPSAILCVSAHWLTRGGYALTASPAPRTIHDFGGFPPELFAQQYPAPGAPELAAELVATLRSGGFNAALDTKPNTEPGNSTSWGLDHGSWGVLKPMFPAADIPVLQLSIDFAAPLAQHYAVGQLLGGLFQERLKDVLLLGSGNVVHNLREMNRQRQHGSSADTQTAAPWAAEFDGLVKASLLGTHSASHQSLIDLPNTHAALYHRAHNGHPDHFLPLLFCAGAAAAKEQHAQWVDLGFQGDTVSMASVVWQ